LLGISGGLDSMVLLHLFQRARIKFAVAHCNYQLRGSASDQDALFVAAAAKALGVPFYGCKFDTNQLLKAPKTNLQALARTLRYDWFDQLCQDHQYDAVAVAHHQNDGIETVLMNLTKGCGIRGLHGIWPKNKQLIRPMLFATKDQIRDYAAKHKLDYREDLSNNNLKYVRNAIRHQVIPSLQHINPQLEKTFTQNIGIFRQVEALYHFAIQTLKAQIVSQKEGMLYIDIKGLSQSPAPTSLLFEILRPYQFKISKIDYIYACKDQESGSIYTSQSHFLLRDRTAWIVVAKSAIDQHQYSLEISTPGGQQQLNPNLSINWTFLPHVETENLPKNTAIFDAKKLLHPLTLRHWAAGDSFYPAGMKGKKKKLSKFFKDNKLNRFEKDQTWLLCNGDGAIIWIIGQRTDERFRPAEGSQNYLQIAISQLKPDAL
jgi:tRNA(Ile)-lysidine synthase